jgi:hypothetical protein
MSTASTHSSPHPFSLQAARFSFFAPFILGAMNCLVQPLVTRDLERRPELPLVVVLAWLLVITLLSALVLGVIGFIGGVRRKALGTMALAGIGIVLDIGMLVFPTLVVVSSLAPPSRPVAASNPQPAEAPIVWKTFKSEEGRFKVLLPEEVKTIVQGDIHAYQAQLAGFGVAFLSHEFRGDKLDLKAELAQRETIPGVKGAIQSRAIRLGSHDGLEATYEGDVNGRLAAIHHRLYDRDGNLYEVMIMHLAGEDRTEEIENIFGSFEWTGE